MLSIFLRFLLFLAGMLFISRLLRIFSGAGKKSAPTPPAAAPGQTAMVRDPICGMYLDPRLAIRLDRKQETLYFCSNECRQRFELKAT